MLKEEKEKKIRDLIESHYNFKRGKWKSGWSTEKAKREANIGSWETAKKKLNEAIKENKKESKELTPVDKADLYSCQVISRTYARKLLRSIKQTRGLDEDTRTWLYHSVAGAIEQIPQTKNTQEVEELTNYVITFHEYLNNADVSRTGFRIREKGTSKPRRVELSREDKETIRKIADMQRREFNKIIAEHIAEGNSRLLHLDKIMTDNKGIVKKEALKNKDIRKEFFSYMRDVAKKANRRVNIKNELEPKIRRKLKPKMKEELEPKMGGGVKAGGKGSPQDPPSRVQRDYYR